MRNAKLALVMALVAVVCLMAGCPKEQVEEAALDVGVEEPLELTEGPEAELPPGVEMPEFADLAPSEPYRIALIMKTMSNPFFQTMGEGAEAEAEALGVELITTAAPKETSDEKQAGLVENAIASGVDAIVIAPADSKTLVPALLKANAAGIPVINVDNRPDRATVATAELAVVTFIGPDNAEGAEKACAHLFESMGGAGKVAMLEGIRGVDNAERRKLGFERALAANEGMELVDSQSANWELEQGESVFANMLTANPEIKGLFCANDMMALGALRAIESSGKSGEILVAAYDNLDEVQPQIASGELLCTVEQHPDLMGAYGVRCAVALLEGNEIPVDIAVPTDLVTGETAE